MECRPTWSLRLLVALAAAASLALAVGGSARAAVNFDPSTLTGFISRGDVISAAGKQALVAQPIVAWNRGWQVTVLCTWSDGTQQDATASLSQFFLFLAQPRSAGGGGANASITGYDLLPSGVIDGEATPPGWEQGACDAAAGGVDHGSLVGDPTFVSRTPFVDTLSYFWGAGQATLPLTSPHGAGAS